MTAAVYDAIVVGAGSVGMPAAMSLAEKGLKVLCLDQFASPGQGSNKAAIGGIRATHSAPAKIRLCLDSLKTFSTWKETHGDDIEWCQGGYLFVAYRPEEEKTLKDCWWSRRRPGLNIDWYEKDDSSKLAPGLDPRGSAAAPTRPRTARPRRCSPPRLPPARRASWASSAASASGSPRIIRRKGKVVGVRTDKGGYATDSVVNAAGPGRGRSRRPAASTRRCSPTATRRASPSRRARSSSRWWWTSAPTPGSRNYYFYQPTPGR